MTFFLETKNVVTVIRDFHYTSIWDFSIGHSTERGIKDGFPIVIQQCKHWIWLKTIILVFLQYAFSKLFLYLTPSPILFRFHLIDYLDLSKTCFVHIPIFCSFDLKNKVIQSISVKKRKSYETTTIPIQQRNYLFTENYI